VADLTETPMLGTSMGAGLYKIRLAIKSKGKSGGFRVVSYLVTQTDDETTIFLLTIYDKSEDSNIDRKTLLDMVSNLSE